MDQPKQPDIITYRDIPGWFDFHVIYNRTTSYFNDGDILVELGCFLGKSLAYLLEKASEKGKNFDIYAVDYFKITPDYGSGSMPWSQDAMEWQNENGGEDALFNYFLNNVSRVPGFKQLKIIRGDSSDASKNFANESVSFCFIDASHIYENVKKDIESWYPKIKRNGVIGGHDYNTDVKKAVDEFFGDKHDIYGIGNSWIVEKNYEKNYG